MLHYSSRRHQPSRSRSPLPRLAKSNQEDRDQWADSWQPWNSWRDSAWKNAQSWHGSWSQSSSYSRASSPPAPPPAPQVHEDLSDITALPHWKTDESHWDTTVVHGFTLPKHVVVSPFSKQSGIAGKPVLSLPLHTVIPFQSDSWALRYMAHGKFVQWEAFRSKREAIVCQQFCKLVRDDPAVDLDAIASQIAIGQNRSFVTWEDKMFAYQLLAQQLFSHAKSLMPCAVTDTTKQRIEELEKENARLKASQLETVASKTAQEVVPVPSLPVTSPIKAALNRGAPACSLSEHSSSSNMEPWQRANRRKVLSDSCPNAHQRSSVTSWINKLKLSKSQTQAFESMIADMNSRSSSEIVTPLADVACDWGMPVSLACKMPDNELTRCIAVACALAK